MPYDAFVSYSHESPDLAHALQDALQRFSKPWYRRSPFVRVFRDSTSLGAGHDLSDKITHALDDSGHLVVVLSPAAAVSPWVDSEIAHFLTTKGREHATFVVERWAADVPGAAPANLEGFAWNGDDVPPSVRGHFVEPLAVDMRWTTAIAGGAATLTLDDERFRDDVATIAASIKGQNKDELIGALVAMRARARILTGSILLGMAILLAAIAVSVPGWLSARSAQRSAEAAVEAAEAQLDDLDQQLAAAGIDLAVAQQRLDTTESDLAVAEQNLLLVESDLTATQRERDQARADRDAAAAARDQALSARDAAAAARDEAESERDVAAAARDAALAERDAADAARSAAEADLALAEGELSETQGELAETNAQLDEVAGQLDDAKEDLDDAERAVTDALDEVDFQKAVAEAIRLSTASAEALESEPEIAALLGLEAVAATSDVTSRSPARTQERFAESVGATRFVTPPAEAALYGVAASPWRQTIEHTNSISQALFSPDGRFVLTSGCRCPGPNQGFEPEYSLKFWNRDGSLERTVSVPERLLRLRYSPDGSLIAGAGGFANAASLWTADGVPVATLESGGFVASVDFDPTGTQLVSASTDGIATLWDVGGRPLRSFDHGDGLTAATITSDGEHLVTTASFVLPERSVKVWSIDDGTMLHELVHAGGAPAAVSPDGALVATLPDERTVALIEPATGEEVARYDAGGAVSHLLFDRSGTWLLSVGHDAPIKVYNVDDRSEHERRFNGDVVLSVWFDRSTSRFVTGHRDDVARVWEILDEGIAEVATLPQSGYVRSGDFDPTGSTVLTAVADGVARIWNPRGLQIDLLTTGFINEAEFSPDGAKILTTSVGADVPTELFTADGTLIATLPGEALYASRFSADGSTIVNWGAAGSELDGSTPGLARLWRSDGAPIGSIETDEQIVAAAINPAATLVATVGFGGAGEVWQVAADPARRAVLGRSVATVEFSPDGRRILTADDGDTASVWDVDGTLVATLRGHGGRAWWAAWGRDGDVIVTGGRDGSARVWDTDGRLLRVIAGDSDFPMSPRMVDDDMVVTHAGLGSATLWDLDGGPMATLSGYGTELLDLDVSPDGRRIATVTQAGSPLDDAAEPTFVKLWHLDGTLLVDLRVQGSPSSVNFSSDGSQLLTSSRPDVISGTTGTVELWQALDVDDLLDEAGGRLRGRGFGTAGCARFGIDPCPA